MLVRSIDREVGVGPWTFVVHMPTETVLVHASTSAQASFWALSLRNDPRIECEVSPVFGPQVVRYYQEG